MADNGWPTPADIYREVQATRADVRAMCAQLDAQATALAEHRADDRRELDGLWQRTDQLRGRERWLAGGLAAVVVLLTVGVPVLLTVVG